MNMTDQERAAMLAKGFQWLAEGKKIEITSQPDGSAQDWNYASVTGLSVSALDIQNVRLYSETITATVTIPKPLTEWPTDGSVCWQSTVLGPSIVSTQCYKIPVWIDLLNAGVMFASEKEALDCTEAIRKFRTGEST